MTESEWLRARNPEAMLRLVAGRYSPRRWHLLACNHARRAIENLPDGQFSGVIDWVEQNAGHTQDHPDLDVILKEVEASSRAMVETARTDQRQIVLAADPDADPDAFGDPEDAESSPALPLFQAACRAAAASIAGAAETVTHGLEALFTLLQTTPGMEQVSAVRLKSIETSRVRASANINATLALKLKNHADTAADLETSKSGRLRRASAEATLERENEFAGQKQDDLYAQKQKVDRKALGRYLHDLVGNPYQPYRFDPAWRTETVVGLAWSIEFDRAFDRMPILADALLDADCDEEAILRHCRGTELHAPDGPAHGRGCWVIDLILQTDPDFFGAAPLKEQVRRPAPPAGNRRRQSADGLSQLFEAVRRLDPTDASNRRVE